MDNILPPIPFHIATRGYLGGAYGIATRGYLVLPDVISKFPAIGTVQYDGLTGTVYDDFWAAMVQSSEIRAFLESSSDIEASLRFIFMNAKVDPVVWGKGEVVSLNKAFVGEVESILFEVDIDDAGLCVELHESDDQAEVQQCENSVIVEEKPGEGRCSK